MLRYPGYLPAAALHLLLVLSNLLMQVYAYRPTATEPETAKGLPALILCMGHAILIFLAPTSSASQRAALSAPRRLLAQLGSVPGGEGWDCFAAALTAIHFFAVGALEYSYTMFKACTVATSKSMDITSCSEHEHGGPYDEQTVEPLTFLEGLYFAVVITTTVGYGHSFTPVTPAGRTFTIYYSISGLVIFALATAHFGKLFDGLVASAKGMIARMRGASARTVAPEPGKNTVGTEAGCKTGEAAEGKRGEDLVKPLDPTEHLPIEVAAHYEQSSLIFVLFIKFLVVNFACAAIFVTLEPDWGFQDAIYHCIM